MKDTYTLEDQLEAVTLSIMIIKSSTFLGEGAKNVVAALSILHDLRKALEDKKALDGDSDEENIQAS